MIHTLNFPNLTKKITNRKWKLFGSQKPECHISFIASSTVDILHPDSKENFIAYYPLARHQSYYTVSCDPLFQSANIKQVSNQILSAARG